MDATSLKRRPGRPRKTTDPNNPAKSKRSVGKSRKIIEPEEPVKPKGERGPHSDTKDPRIVKRRSKRFMGIPAVTYTERPPEESTLEEDSDTTTPTSSNSTLQPQHASSPLIDFDPLADDDDDDDDNDNDTDSDNDDSDDDDFLCESDTYDDDLLARYIDGIDKDELEYLIRDQELNVDNETRQIPTLYYPTLKNRLYAFMRSITIRHIYRVCAYTFLFLTIVFLINQFGQHKSIVRRNGYCTSFHGNSGDAMNQLCIPCPPHGDCTGGKLFCHPLYRPHRSMMNKILNIIWPTPQKCTKDPTMLKHAKKMETRILNYLARRQGDYQCKQYRFDHKLRNMKRSLTFKPVKTNVTLMMDNLKPSFALPVAYSQDHQVELDHLVELALNLTVDNRHVFLGGSGADSYLMIDYAKYSFDCWCWVNFFKAPMILTLGGPVLFGVVLLYMNWAKNRRQVKAITVKALDLLKEQRQKHLETGGLQGPGCSGNYLRLHVLPATDSNSIDIWKRVVRSLQQHPGIRKGYTDENGEILQYFEWL